MPFSFMALVNMVRDHPLAAAQPAPQNMEHLQAMGWGVWPNPEPQAPTEQQPILNNEVADEALGLVPLQPIPVHEPELEGIKEILQATAGFEVDPALFWRERFWLG
jgi:hypothetical protein